LALAFIYIRHNSFNLSGKTDRNRIPKYRLRNVLSMKVGCRKQGMHSEVLYGNVFENIDFEILEGDGRLILRWELGTQFLRVIGGWDWLRTVFSAEFWE
jgi:hypothetical protein